MRAPDPSPRSERLATGFESAVVRFNELAGSLTGEQWRMPARNHPTGHSLWHPGSIAATVAPRWDAAS